MPYPAWKSSHILYAFCPFQGISNIHLHFGDALNQIEQTKAFLCFFHGLKHLPALGKLMLEQPGRHIKISIFADAVALFHQVVHKSFRGEKRLFDGISVNEKGHEK